MAEETIRQRRPKKIRRVQIGFNVLAQIVLILFLAAMVNSIAFKHYQRWDFSRDQKYALSDKTKRFLRTIKGKMRIIVFFSPSTPIAADVQTLLTEYQYAAKGKIDIEYIDPERNLSRAKEIFDKYKVVSDESLLVIDYEGRNKTVKASEMAEVDQSGMGFGEGPRVTAFKGEQAITSAMMDLVEGKKNALGYVLGHKEPPLSENSTISVLKTFIENDRVRDANIRIQPLIQAEKGYFAEKDYNTDDQAKFQTDAKKAGASPTIGASIEKGGSADERVQVNSSRLVVVSNATFVQDNAVTQDQQALDFVSGSVNWLLSREQLIGIAPKIPKPLTFSLNEDALRNLRWIVLVLMPLVFAALGTAVWWKRRVWFFGPIYELEDYAYLSRDSARRFRLFQI